MQRSMQQWRKVLHLYIKCIDYTLSYVHTWCVCSDLKMARADLEAMKKQAESTNREFDRVAAENQKLQVSLSTCLWSLCMCSCVY